MTAPAATAQDVPSPDSTAVAPDSIRTAAPREATADTLALVAPAAPLALRPVTPLPATTTALDATGLFGAPGSEPGAGAGLGYDLGTPGRSAGLSLDGVAPDRLGLVLDGRPLADLFTGAPRLDVLPWEAADRLALADARGGPLAVVAALRPFRLRVPVTELRFHSGEGSLQMVSGTHAQTRGAPWRIGGPRARMTTTVHVAGREANGPLTGARLRHANAILRLALATPRWGAELTEHYTERTDGARRGVVQDANFYSTRSASVLDGNAERRGLRNEIALRVRAPLAGSEPLAMWASWTRQTTRFRRGLGADTVSTSGNRYAVGASQRLGARGPSVRAWVAAEDDPWGSLDALGDENARLQVHAALADTLAVGGLRLAAQVGGHMASGAFGPAVALRAETGPLYAAASWTGTIPGRIESSGFTPEAILGPGVILTAAPDGQERTLRAEVGASGARGSVSFGARVLGSVVTDASRLVVLEDVSTALPEAAAFGYMRASGALTMLGARATVGWREGSDSGLYSTASAAVTSWSGNDPLASRMDEAAPTLHGRARLGVRATRVGTGTAALDAGATVRAWSAFRSVRLHPATGLVALASPEAARLPARPVLDLDASVTFGTRARLAVTWENVLAGSLYNGAALVQGEPLAPSQLRFGVFWALTE